MEGWLNGKEAKYLNETDCNATESEAKAKGLKINFLALIL